MLEDCLFESQGRRKTRKPFTVFVATIIHVIIGIVLVLIPLFQTQAITIPMADMSLWAPQPESRRAVEVTTVPPPVRTRVAADPNDVIAPPSMPSGIADIVDESAFPSVDLPLPTALHRFTKGDPKRMSNLSLDNLEFSQEQTMNFRRRTILSTTLLIALAIPCFAQLVLEALITREGAVDSLRVISGHQLLIQAALDAVRQWRYRPTLLNGEPVEVITTITVTFTLQ
ncbi:MAG: hypothetical protein DMG13_15100 [Acidobacteria bacterium]|nr:MAG: hypothetical protein DMG13_15100 [Acidobacteriota bacterium]